MFSAYESLVLFELDNEKLSWADELGRIEVASSRLLTGNLIFELGLRVSLTGLVKLYVTDFFGSLLQVVR